MGADGVAPGRVHGGDFWGGGSVCRVLCNLNLGVLVELSIDLPTVRVGSAHCRLAAESIRLVKMARLGALEKFLIPERALDPAAGVVVDAGCVDADVWVCGDEDLDARWVLSRAARVGVMLYTPPWTPRAAMLSVAAGGVFCYSPAQRDFFTSYVPRSAFMADAIARYLWNGWGGFA